MRRSIPLLLLLCACPALPPGQERELVAGDVRAALAAISVFIEDEEDQATFQTYADAFDPMLDAWVEGQTTSTMAIRGMQPLIRQILERNNVDRRQAETLIQLADRVLARIEAYGRGDQEGEEASAPEHSSEEG